MQNAKSPKILSVIVSISTNDEILHWDYHDYILVPQEQLKNLDTKDKTLKTSWQVIYHRHRLPTVEKSYLQNGTYPPSRENIH